MYNIVHGLAGLSICALLLAGCSSPLSIETPRINTRLTNYLAARSLHITVTPGDTFAIPDWSYLVDRAYVAVDTTLTPPRMWLDYDLRASPESSVFNRALQRVHIRMDSVTVRNGSIYMDGDPDLGTGTSVKTVYNSPDNVRSSLAVLDQENTASNVKGSILIQAPWSGTSRATILVAFVLER